MANMKLTSIFFIVIPLVFSGCAERISKHGPLSGDMSISPDDQHILFSFYKHNVSSIYVADINGKNVKQLTFAKKEFHLCPKYSPNGQKISFLVFPQGTKKLQSYLYLMNSDGTDIHQITTDQQHVTEAVFSSDSKKIYFLRSNYYGHYSPMVSSRPHDFDIYSTDIDGSNLKRLTNLEEYEMSNLSITPSGQHLLFSTYDERTPFHLLSLADPNQINSFMPSGAFGSTIFYDPKLSPKDESIAFVAVSKSPKPGFQYELYLMNLKSKKTKQVTKLDSRVKNPCFLNSQNKLLFMQDLNWPERYPNYQLMSINSDGTNLMNIELIVP